MKIQRSGFLLVLFVCTLSCPLVGKTEAVPFVKLVSATGFIRETIPDVRGGFVSISSQGENSYLVRRARQSGEAVWETVLHFPPFVSLSGISQTTDGGYVLVGQSQVLDAFEETKITRALVVKLQPNGKVQWKRTFSVDGGNVRLYKVVSMPDGGFIACGGVNINPSVNLLLVRFNSTGEIRWSKGFDISASVVSLLRSDDNKIVVTTSSARVIKFDSSGNIVAAKSFYSPHFHFETANKTFHRGLILAGVSQVRRNTNYNQLALIGLQSDLKVAWTAKFQVQSHRPSITDVIQTSDNGFAITGGLAEGEDRTISLHSFLMKIDSSREVIFLRTYATQLVGFGSIFAFGNSGYFIFSSNRDGDTQISNLDSSGAFPNCGLFFSVPFETIPFGELKPQPIKTRPGTDISLTINDIEINSESLQNSVSTVCQ